MSDGATVPREIIANIQAAIDDCPTDRVGDIAEIVAARTESHPLHHDFYVFALCCLINDAINQGIIGLRVGD